MSGLRFSTLVCAPIALVLMLGFGLVLADQDAAEMAYVPLVRGPGQIQPQPSATPTQEPAPAGRIEPGDLEYRGAFRLPQTSHALDNVGWEWGGTALAYHVGGDAGGAADGYPGSLYGAGHNQTQYVSEVRIPAPVVSAGKSLGDLPVATTLQPFTNIREHLYDTAIDEWSILRAGLAILSPPGGRESQLCFAWAMHAPGNESDAGPSHGVRPLHLDDGASQGIWRVGGLQLYLTGDILFEAPEAWAATHTEGRQLITGRYRDGGQAAQGPSLFAVNPWESGGAPSDGATLSATTLLRYEPFNDPDPASLSGYHHSDEWSGGAWLSSGENAAVVLVGTKGQGDCWYGCRDGTVWPDEPPYPPECAERGWWSSAFQAQAVFYDPADLAQVAAGTVDAASPQPYATLDLTPWLFSVTDPQQKHQVGAAAFDAESELLYVTEFLVDDDRPIVHVWHIE